MASQAFFSKIFFLADLPPVALPPALDPPHLMHTLYIQCTHVCNVHVHVYLIIYMYCLHLQSIYDKIMPHYFPRSRAEEEFAAKAMPPDIGEGDKVDACEWAGTGWGRGGGNG